jgi:hypothetical protein
MTGIARGYRVTHLMGYYDLPVHERPLREGLRDTTNHYVPVSTR